MAVGDVTFEEFVRRAAGCAPYPYQAELAEIGLPDVLAVPTGAGKTLAATLPWLYRRRFHPDPAVRATAPHWLVLTLPMRVLVEQTVATVRTWLDALDVGADVGLYQLMGGEGRRDAAWRYAPERDAIFVGTLDMLLSRALNRGYGESRWVWPVEFGLFNAGCQWVFDEVQLMGPGLVTSRQLDGLRRALGTAGDCRSMWMSATIRRDDLVTVDNAELGRVVGLTGADRTGPLAVRLDAGKTVRELTGMGTGKAYLSDLATAVVEKHKGHGQGTRSIVVVNTVDRAVELYKEMRRQFARQHGDDDIPCVLVHSRFRPLDRQRAVHAALAGVDPAGPGRIVVTTQVLEAGVDVSATTLVTELAPWPSIVQRAGRCNRDGSDHGAELWWVRPPKALPYDEVELKEAASVLVTLEGSSGAPAVLDALDVAREKPLHPVLRRRDLVELFDTLPDLSGNDVDVARFIRDVDDIDVQVAWRDVGPRDASPDASEPLPSRDERCPVPLAGLRDHLRKPGDPRRAWRHDHLSGQWTRCFPEDLRPGQVLILDAGQGGYDAELGWSPSSTTPVPVVVPGDERGVVPAPVEITDGDTAVGGDPISYTHSRRWVGLGRHLEDVEREVRRLAAALAPTLPPALIDAAVLAGRYHDLGKAHEVFQRTLAGSAADDAELAAAAEEPAPWAKSGGSLRPRHGRPHFRHELASALALLGQGGAVLRHVAEPDLVVYLVAAHHGRVRLGFRSLPGEKVPEESDRPFALGIWQGDGLPTVELTGEVVPESELDLSSMQLGRSDDGTPSWSERALALRDRGDLGPFRLGFLEALVRTADWIVSAGYDDPQGASRA